jgi:hypothetical protein
MLRLLIFVSLAMPYRCVQSHTCCASSGCALTDDCEWCEQTGWRSRCELCEERCGSEAFSAVGRVAIVLFGQLPRLRHCDADVNIAQSIALIRDAVVPSLMKRLVAPAQARGARVAIFGHSWANGRDAAEVSGFCSSLHGYQCATSRVR